MQLKAECGLPSRNEFIVFCHLTESQVALYDLYIRSCIEQLKQQSYEQDEVATNENNLLQVISSMRKIVNHPYLFFGFHCRKIEEKNQKNGRFGFECIKRMRVDALPEYKEFMKKKQQQTSLLHYKLSEDRCKIGNVLKETEAQLIFKDWQMSGKLMILVKFLDDWNSELAGNKVLVFSQTKKMLDLLELILAEREMVFCRMDGDLPLKQRMDTIEHFNTLQSSKLQVFLLTTRVGGLGINLTSANKVVIFDPDWNPMVDVQATERAFRIGQTRDVNIYRFVSEDTIEEKIYHRQIFKKFMADRILADPARRKLFERETLYNLLTLPKRSPQ